MVTPVRPQNSITADTAFARARERLSAIIDALDAPLAHSPPTLQAGPLTVWPSSNTTPAEYERMVSAAKEYIAAGDIFQVVLSQRFEAPFELPPFALYRALRRVNPAPFLYFLDFGGFSIVGSSPEILVRVREGTVTIRPLAGTRPRGATPNQDKALETELLADEKERAEHLMLLDLGRNDVGRVARTASVKVTDQFFIERFSQVMHIVSNVEGQLDGKYDALDALAAGFPAGTVSGAPKVRAMEIIDELEQEKRGTLCRLGGLLFRGRRARQLYRVAHGADQGWRDVCPGRRRNRRRFQSQVRATGMRRQGQGVVPRCGGGQAICQRRSARAIDRAAHDRRNRPRACGEMAA